MNLLTRKKILQRMLKASLLIFVLCIYAPSAISQEQWSINLEWNEPYVASKNGKQIKLLMVVTKKINYWYKQPKLCPNLLNSI